MKTFSIFPWDVPFLPHLQHYVCTSTQYAPGRSVIIVPHNRPRRYLTNMFCQDTSLPRPALLPRILTVSEMIALFRAQTTAPQRTAQTLDRVALLHRCVLALATSGDDEALCQRFANMDMAHFFPWGLRLASLLEECLTQQVEAKDMPYTEGEVSPTASALLGALGRIHARYVGLLEAEGWTTPGLDAFCAAREVTLGTIGVPPLLRPEEGHGGRQVFIAGLAVLSNAESVLLRSLWENGAHICLHTDPALIQATEPGHWACADHRRWMRHWKAHGTLITPPSHTRPKIHFLAGYDLHSQLLAVQHTLEAEEATPEQNPQASTAIVLTNASLLMPTLHHMPQHDFNVSMGYPLDHSPLFRLLEALMRLQATARPANSTPATHAPKDEDMASVEGQTRYYWRSLLQVLRHPYVQMLQTLPPTPTQEQAQDKVQTLREPLHRMETLLRGGTRFASPQALASQAKADTTTEQCLLLDDILNVCVINFATVQSPADMAKALSALCDLLLQHGGEIWSRYPLDAEALYRLMQKVIPSLKESSLADVFFPPATLFSLTRQLIRAERVPFEADPIAGLQILGMLETRLLHFDRLLVVDATDDALPGFTAQDPLLPDALRVLLGLPDAHRRERTAAHTLYRLMASAKEVHFFWQEGMQHSTLFDDKKMRSRFVEECLWQVEQEQGALLHSDTPPMRLAPCPVHPVPRNPQRLPAGPALRHMVRQLLTKGISPTKVDSYLHCPQRFAWEHLYRLRPLQEVNEGDDPAAVGKLVHEVLHKAYSPWLHKDLYRGNLSLAALIALWEQMLLASDLRTTLPPDSYIMLAMAGPLRLEKYLERQPEVTKVVALEHALCAPVTAGEKADYMLAGTLDRVDTRSIDEEQRMVVLDYKTGTVQRPPLTAWTDLDLWQDIQLWTPGQEDGDLLLDRVSKAFPSLQLPCYLHMCRHASGEAGSDAAFGSAADATFGSAADATFGSAADAAWVALRDSGEEVFLLGENLAEDIRQTVLQVRIPQLLSFVLRHLEQAEHFDPREGKQCTHCPYSALCRK